MSSTPNPASQEAPRPLVLLVEDDPRQLQRLVLELECSGVDVLPAKNGTEALHYVKTARINGIVSDIQMPLIDGYQLCRILKDDPATAPIPILLLTGMPTRFSGLWARTCGADQMLTKDEFHTGIGAFLAGLRPDLPPPPRKTPCPLPNMGELQTLLDHSLENKLLESGVRQTIHSLCRHVGHPAQMAWAFLDLVKEIAFPGVVYVAWPGPQGEHLFVLEATGFPDAQRENLDAQLLASGKPVAKHLRRQAPCTWPWPETWESLEFRVPAMDKSEGRWGLFTDARILEDHREVLNLIHSEMGLVLQNVLAYHQLLRSNAELRSADLARAELIQVVSHEIRTPITAIQLYMDLLEARFMDKLPPEERRGLRATQESIAGLLDLINSVLDLERSAHHAMNEKPAPLDVHSLAKGALKALSVLGKTHQVSLRLERDHSQTGQFKAMGNPHRLVRCFINLVSNAIKFSPPHGEVRVRILETLGWVRVEIEDQGPGIPDSFTKEIFTPFHQADSDHGGSGLGLSITRNLVEGMGGRVGFSPAQPTGTIFWFELPALHEKGEASGA